MLVLEVWTAPSDACLSNCVIDKDLAKIQALLLYLERPILHSYPTTTITDITTDNSIVQYAYLVFPATLI